MFPDEDVFFFAALVFLSPRLFRRGKFFAPRRQRRRSRAANRQPDDLAGKDHRTAWRRRQSAPPLRAGDSAAGNSAAGGGERSVRCRPRRRTETIAGHGAAGAHLTGGDVGYVVGEKLWHHYWQGGAGFA